MRKTTLCLLVLFGLFFAFAAGAEETFLSNAAQVYTGTTTVSLTIEEKYTVVIPPSLPLVYGTEETPLTLAVSGLDLTPGYAVRIAVESPEGALTQVGGDGRIPYTLTGPDGPFTEKVTRTEGEFPLSVTVGAEDWFAAPAGEYDGLITFSVSAGKYTVKEGE